jgi:hypothetical protein
VYNNISMSKELPQSIVEIPSFYETESGLIVANYAASLALATEGYIDPETGFLARNPIEVTSNVMDVMSDTRRMVGQNTTLALELFQELAGAGDAKVLQKAMGETLHSGASSIRDYASSPEAASAARIAFDSKVRQKASRETLYGGASSIRDYASPEGRQALRSDFDAKVLQKAMGETLHSGASSIRDYASSPEAASAARIAFDSKVRQKASRETLYGGASSIRDYASPEGRQALRSDFDAKVLQKAMGETLHSGASSIRDYASSPEAASAMRLKFNDKVTGEINRSSSARKALTTINDYGFGEEFISKSKKAVADKWLEPTRQELNTVQAAKDDAIADLQKLRNAGFFHRLFNRRKIRDLKTSVFVCAMRAEGLSGVIMELEASTTTKTKRSRSTANLRLVPNPND